MASQGRTGTRTLEQMHTRVEITSIAVTAAILFGVFELVRRRKLGERYALLWMGAAAVLLLLAIWQSLLHKISRAVGIYYPPNAFFVIAFGFSLLLLLHFSIATSRLARETRTLAQRLALLEGELRGSDSEDDEETTADHDIRPPTGEQHAQPTQAAYTTGDLPREGWGRGHAPAGARTEP